MIASGAQAVWLPTPSKAIPAYLAIWITTALVSAALIASQMFARTRRMHSGMADEMIRMAVEQFLPSVGAGALMTIWQIIFSLGVFSSCRFLPRPMVVAGAWYLLTGLVCISLADARAFSPWAMAIPYGMGQLLVAVILLLNSQGVDDDI